VAYEIDLLKKNKKVFFIFGCPRSGTSLLSRILNAHPNIAVPPESLIYGKFSSQKAYGDLSTQKDQEKLLEDILLSYELKVWEPKVSRELASTLMEESGFGSVFDAILSSWAFSQNKSHWGEKTPRHIFHWREIQKQFPNAKIIHIVRDGRDVGLSLLKARFGPKTIFSAANLWVKYLDEFERIKLQTNESVVYEIKYEELLTDPENVLKGVCKFLGEEYSSDLLEFYKNDTPYKTDVINEQNLRNPLLITNAGKWKTVMKEDMLKVFESIASRHLKKFGYEVKNYSAKLSRVEQCYYQYLLSPFMRIISMAKNTQGYREAAEFTLIKVRRKIFNIVERISS